MFTSLEANSDIFGIIKKTLTPTEEIFIKWFDNRSNLTKFTNRSNKIEYLLITQGMVDNNLEPDRCNTSGRI